MKKVIVTGPTGAIGVTFDSGTDCKPSKGLCHMPKEF